MTNEQSIADLLAEAARSTPDIDTVIETVSDQFEIHMSDGVIIEAEFDPEALRITLSAELGIVPEGRERTAFAALLLYNSLWRETGGVTTALSGVGEPALLTAGFFTAGIEAKEIADFITDFKRKADIWKVYVTAADEPDISARPSDEFSFIRA